MMVFVRWLGRSPQARLALLLVLAVVVEEYMRLGIFAALRVVVGFGIGMLVSAVMGRLV